MAVIFPPDRMMIIEHDGSEKHERMFTLRDGKVEWWKPNRWIRANKGPFNLRTVERYGKHEAGLLRLVMSDGVARIVRPQDDEMRERWLTALHNPADDTLSDPGSDLSEPSLLSTPSQASPPWKALKQREEKPRAHQRLRRVPPQRVPSRRVTMTPSASAPRYTSGSSERRSPRGSRIDAALSDLGSDISEPSLLLTPARAKSELAAPQQRPEVQHRTLELERGEDDVRWREQGMQRAPRRLVPRRATQRRVSQVCGRRSTCVVRRTTPDFDLAVGQRVQYLSIDQGRWVRATVTRLNADYSVDLDGDDGIMRRNYHVFRNGRRVIR